MAPEEEEGRGCEEEGGDGGKELGGDGGEEGGDGGGCEHLPTNYNELVITIHGCKGLKRSPLRCPDSYAVYKFHTFPDSDTPIVPNCQDPVFEDTQRFPVSTDHTLDGYLRREVRGWSPSHCRWKLTVCGFLSWVTAIVCVPV